MYSKYFLAINLFLFVLVTTVFFYRYLILLYTAVYSLKNKQFVKDKKSVYRKESDICMLQLFKSFMGAAPQLVLQLYIIVILHDAPIWTSKFVEYNLFKKKY